LASGRKAILCVDDEAILVLALKRELERALGDRYEIATALDADAADEAVAALSSRGVELALVICDWRMPGRGGAEFLASLRARMPAMKSVLLTGQTDDEAMRQARSELGVAAIVSKPWRIDLLLGAIESCLN
jgi:DNA-binding NarL/FixJ family response regulator